MDEIKDVKRLVNLTAEEEEELQARSVELKDLAADVVSSYDGFEKGKVRVGRLKTLLDNFIYKVNFAYKDLHKTAGEVKEALDNAEKSGAKASAALRNEVEKFLSENKELKQYRS